MSTPTQFFTVERAYLLPVFQHVTVEAETPEQAARQALDLDDWASAKKDYDNSRAVYIDGIWSGEDAAYQGEQHAVPADLLNPERTNQEKLERLLVAIANEKAVWALRQAPAGEDNADRDQEEADTVVETLNGILEAAGFPVAADAQRPLVVVLDPVEAYMVHDALDILRPDTDAADDRRLALVDRVWSYIQAVPEPRSELEAADVLTPEERALHVCEVAGCDRIPEAGAVCNACLPGCVADPAAIEPTAPEDFDAMRFRVNFALRSGRPLGAEDQRDFVKLQRHDAGETSGAAITIKGEDAKSGGAVKLSGVAAVAGGIGCALAEMPDGATHRLLLN